MDTKRTNISFLYGFVLGLGLAIIFIPLSTSYNEGNGISTTTYKEPMRYFVSILRTAFITGFIGVIGSFLSNKNK
jgi:hypothetical protein